MKTLASFGGELPHRVTFFAKAMLNVQLKILTVNHGPLDCPAASIFKFLSVPVEGAEVGGHSTGNAASTTSFTFMVPSRL